MDKDYKGLLLLDLLRPCMFYRSLLLNITVQILANLGNEQGQIKL